MEPITRTEMYLAYAAGGDNDLPTPVTREETFLNGVCARLDTIEKPTAEEIQTAVDNYLDENGISGLTQAEIEEVLNG